MKSDANMLKAPSRLFIVNILGGRRRVLWFTFFVYVSFISLDFVLVSTVLSLILRDCVLHEYRICLFIKFLRARCLVFVSFAVVHLYLLAEFYFALSLVISVRFNKLYHEVYYRLQIEYLNTCLYTAYCRLWY
jgi:hypothetical protein